MQSLKAIVRNGRLAVDIRHATVNDPKMQRGTRRSSKERSNPSRATVIVKQCDAYEEAQRVLRATLEEAGFALQGQRVLIKPNLMKADPERAHATHPAFVGALTRLLVEQGCEVEVGDASGLLGLTREVFDASGMTDAVQRAGGRVVSFDDGPFVSVEVGGRVNKPVWVPRVLFEADVVLSVPKLKTHTLTGMSCGIKNLMGLLPGATKCDLHVDLPDAALLSHGLIDLVRSLSEAGVRFGGSVVDAVWAQEAKGHAQGSKTRHLGLVIASTSLAAADIAAAKLIEGEAATVRAASRRGYGPKDISEVDLRGDVSLLEQAPLEPAVPGVKDRFRLLHAAHYRLRGRIVQPVHVPSRCCETRACVDACPVRCIEVKDGRMRIGDACIRCFACRAACPQDAIVLHVPRWLRRSFASRAEGLDLDGVLR